MTFLVLGDLIDCGYFVVQDSCVSFFSPFSKDSKAGKSVCDSVEEESVLEESAGGKEPAKGLRVPEGLCLTS